MSHRVTTILLLRQYQSAETQPIQVCLVLHLLDGSFWPGTKAHSADLMYVT